MSRKSDFVTPKKIGHPDDRKDVAAFGRMQRNKLPTLTGKWTLKEWNQQVFTAMTNRLAMLTRARRKS